MNLQLEIFEQVCDVLDLGNETLASDDNLIEFGLNSLSIMKLVDQFEQKYAKDLSYTDFVISPTIEDWVRLVANLDHADCPESDRAEQEKATTKSIVVKENINTLRQLSDMQYAYWAGRQAGDAAAHLYVEFSAPQLQLPRLQAALQKLIYVHPMLRLSINQDGLQQIKANVEVRIRQDDLRLYQPAQVTEFLHQKRQQLSHQKLDLQAGQLIDISVSLLPEEKYRIHIDIDMLAADPQCYLQVIEDLSRLYHDENALTVPQRVQYFDYLDQLQQFSSENKQVAEDKIWWLDTIQHTFPAPQLPYQSALHIQDENYFDSFSDHINENQTRKLNLIAEQWDISLSELLLAAFALTIAQWNQTPQFRLNYPVFNQHIANTSFENVVGDFANFILLDIDVKQNQTFEQFCTRLASQLKLRLQHTHYAGIDILRDLSRQHNQTETAPVIFSACLNDQQHLFSSQVTETLGQPIWALSQGPKVNLDSQIFAFMNGILINWDVRLGVFKDRQIIADMFKHYTDLIHYIAESDSIANKQLHQILALYLNQQDKVDFVAGRDKIFIKQLEAIVRQSPDQIAITIQQQKINYQQLWNMIVTSTNFLQHQGIQQNAVVYLSITDQLWKIVSLLSLINLDVKTIIHTEHQNQGVKREDHEYWTITDHDDYVLTQNNNIDLSALKNHYLAESTAQEMILDLNFYPSFQHSQILNTSQQAIDFQYIANQAVDLLEISEFSPQTQLLILDHVVTDLWWIDAFAVLLKGGSIHLYQQDITNMAKISAYIQYNKINTLKMAADHLYELAKFNQNVIWQLERVLFCYQCSHWKLGEILNKINPEIHLTGLIANLDHAIYIGYSRIEHGDIKNKIRLNQFNIWPSLNLQIKNHFLFPCPVGVEGKIYLNFPEYVNQHDQAQQHWVKTADSAYYSADNKIILCGNKTPVFQDDLDLNDLEQMILNTGTVEYIKIFEHHSVLFVAVSAVNLQYDLFKQQMNGLLQNNIFKKIDVKVVIVDDFPLQKTGVIDPDLIDIEAGYDLNLMEDNHSSLEKTITYIFSRITGTAAADIARQDDFFDLGGDSLLATHLATVINKYFQGANITVVDVFTQRTVNDIAQLIYEKLAEKSQIIAELFLEYAGVEE
ncbi:hypothetical protein F4V57_02815 [Acinetobacter qingfengensis]|uniref:Carrier domain-containing protein n=1 Tax=Acinetobacter qingfengensis TaxID=1262585 RepID=A0A1E7R857_9GAMM|nr:condensation domain-containing protein [Acinetobacter qingfengensis]KAA8734713.1 hypothetical protein F4V57_02815 [Acinetobacter qingfengensis]OEY95534.1 hypothetical protein BJI46_12730 [Acinetobacter qingfengensis]